MDFDAVFILAVLLLTVGPTVLPTSRNVGVPPQLLLGIVAVSVIQYVWPLQG